MSRCPSEGRRPQHGLHSRGCQCCWGRTDKETAARRPFTRRDLRLQRSAGTERREPRCAPGRRGLRAALCLHLSARGAAVSAGRRSVRAERQRGWVWPCRRQSEGWIPAKENRLGNTGLPNVPTADSRSSKPHARSQRLALLEAHCRPCPAAGPAARPAHGAPRGAGSGQAEGQQSSGYGQCERDEAVLPLCRAPALRRQRCRCVYRRALEANVLFANRPPPSAAAPPKDNNRVPSAGCEGQLPGEHR